MNISILQHDTSMTGIRYKLVVTLPKRLKKKELGGQVLDLGNSLYRTYQFSYTYNPTVDFKKGITTFTYFFNDVNMVNFLNQFEDIKDFTGESENSRKHYLKHQEKMQLEGYPAFSMPYLRG